jgi:hypothetical protein
MAHATSEIVWLRRLLGHLQVEFDSPTILHCDNQAAIHLASNPVFHERTKHIEVDCHFIREFVSKGVISTVHIPTRSQQADIFTKSLGTRQFQELSIKLGSHNPQPPT